MVVECGSFVYVSYAVWVLGSVGFAYVISRMVPTLPKIVPSALGFSVAVTAAFAFSFAGASEFVSYEIDYYIRNEGKME